MALGVHSGGRALLDCEAARDPAGDGCRHRPANPERLLVLVADGAAFLLV